MDIPPSRRRKKPETDPLELSPVIKTIKEEVSMNYLKVHSL